MYYVIEYRPNKFKFHTIHNIFDIVWQSYLMMHSWVRLWQNEINAPVWLNQSANPQTKTKTNEEKTIKFYERTKTKCEKSTTNEHSTQRESRLFSIFFHTSITFALFIHMWGYLFLITWNRFHDDEHANLLNSMWYVIFAMAQPWFVFNLLEYFKNQ